MSLRRRKCILAFVRCKTGCRNVALGVAHGRNQKCSLCHRRRTWQERRIMIGLPSRRLQLRPLSPQPLSICGVQRRSGLQLLSSPQSAMHRPRQTPTGIAAWTGCGIADEALTGRRVPEAVFVLFSSTGRRVPGACSEALTVGMGSQLTLASARLAWAHNAGFSSLAWLRFEAPVLAASPRKCCRRSGWAHNAGFSSLAWLQLLASRRLSFSVLGITLASARLHVLVSARLSGVVCLHGLVRDEL